MFPIYEPLKFPGPPLVRPAREASGRDVLRLLRGDVGALRLPDFASPEEVGHALSWIDSGERSPYFNDVRVDGEIHHLDFGVDLLDGVVPANTMFDTPSGSPERVRYRESVEPTMQRYRDASHPFPWLGDKVLQYFQLLGLPAQRARLEGADALLGMVRFTRAGETILEDQPHQDRPPEELRVSCEFSANVYLEVPETGGELVSWNRFDPNDALAIKPKVGELVVLPTGIPHGVRTFEGRRTSVQVFMGRAKTFGRPFLMWN